MDFYVQNSPGTIYSLEKTFNVQGTARPVIANFRPILPGWMPRLDISERIGQDGGATTSDRRTGPRNLDFSFDLISESESESRLALNQLIGFFRPDNGPFYLYDTTNNIRTEIEFNGIELARTDNTQYRVMKECSLKLVMRNTYWEDSTESNISSPSGGTANGGTLTITNTGDITLYPILEIEAINDISSFRLENSTLQGGFTLESNAFISGTLFIVNCRTGEITLNDVEKSASLVSGGYFYLVPGVNTLTYTSSDGSVDINVKYRMRYAY